MSKREIPKPTQEKINEIWECIEATLQNGKDVRISVNKENQIVLQEVSTKKISYV